MTHSCLLQSISSNPCALNNRTALSELNCYVRCVLLKSCLQHMWTPRKLRGFSTRKLNHENEECKPQTKVKSAFAQTVHIWKHSNSLYMFPLIYLCANHYKCLLTLHCVAPFPGIHIPFPVPSSLHDNTGNYSTTKVWYSTWDVTFHKNMLVLQALKPKDRET